MTIFPQTIKSAQTLKRKELPLGGDPYSMKKAPKGLLECPECHAVYFRKRWSLPTTPSKSTKSSSLVSRPGGVSSRKTMKPVLMPTPFICPACRKLRDGYAEGFLSINWPNWTEYKAEVLGLIHNEEQRAQANNPLDRVMTIRTRPDGCDIETTTEHLAQRLGKHLNQAFKGKVSFKWSKRDKLARIEWEPALVQKNKKKK